MVPLPQAFRFSAPVFAQYPMHEVVPSAVTIAVAMLAIICTMNLMVSFLLIIHLLSCLVHVAAATTWLITASGVAAGIAAGVLAAAATRGVSTARTAASWLVIRLTLYQTLDVDKLGLLQELPRRDVLLGSLLGQESDVQRLQMLANVKLILFHRAVLLVLQGAVECAKAINLHLLTLQQHLDETRAELLQHAVHHVGGVDRAMLRDVSSQLACVQRFQVLDDCEPLAKCTRYAVSVLFYFVQNLCHNLNVFFMVLDTLRPTTPGDRPPASTASEVQGECRAELARAMLSRSLHSYSQLHVASTKVQHFSCVSKFRPSNWPDFDEEFIEIAHARQNSCEHDSVLA